ncbi:MAG: multiheme c-type cytochrome [Vicinamibacterales bacterium]
MTRLLLLLAAVAAGWVALLAGDRAHPEHAVTHRPVQIPDEGYTSSGACRACHPDQYASWWSSYHRTMTQVARPDTAQASFDDVTVRDAHGGPMQLSTRGDSLWAAFADPDWDGTGAAPPRIEREVVLITGSHQQQIYWSATGRQRLLGQLPAAYLVDERRWIPRRAAVLHPPGDPAYSETGHWNTVCLSCHTTGGKPKSTEGPDSGSPDAAYDTTAVEFGIGCESCHGPGGAHVSANRNPVRRYRLHLTGEPDTSIVQPSRLEPRLSAQVCGQCHGVWEFPDEASARRANTEGLPYRPGHELRDTRFVAQPTVNGDSPEMRALLAADAGFVRDAFWPDGMVRVSGREYNGLLESSCFTSGDGPVTHAELPVVPPAPPGRVRPAAGRRGRTTSSQRTASRTTPARRVTRRSWRVPPRIRATPRNPPAAPATTATCRIRPTAS